MTTKQFIGAWTVASPPLVVKQTDGLAFLKEHYAGQLKPRTLDIMTKVFNHSSVLQRHYALDKPEDILENDPDKKIERFTKEAIKLSTQAAQAAMKEASIEIDEITAIVLNTCTGYICPGLSTYLVESLGLKRDVAAYDLVGSGCGGAVPNLQICQSLLRDPQQQTVISISVEICSATFQIKDDLSLIISNALFGDGAAAAIVWNKPRGLSLLASRSRYAPEYRDDIRFIYREGQLHNQLSKRLPTLVGRTVLSLVTDFLKSQKLSFEDINHWVIHPGGENIIEAVKNELNLKEEQLVATRAILSNFGNMSSATVWFILDYIKKDLKPGDYCLMLTFGAGFSAHIFLLQKC